MHTAIANSVLVAQDDLDIAIKTRSNPLAWNGQFSPQLVHSLVAAYAGDGGAVLDPFAGSATVAGEAISLGHSFIGIEINPAAYILGSLYALAPLSLDRRMSIVNESNILLSDVFDVASSETNLNLGQVRSLSWSRHRSTNVVLASVLMNAFRSSEQARLSDLRRAIERIRDLVIQLPVSHRSVSIRLGDARATGLESKSIDLVVTSPPYINVFNYHQQYRPVVEALGCRPLRIATSEIGANRKHRQNRFLTVVQYCLDIGHALAEMFRVCKADGRIIMVVGRESSVLGVPFRNGELVSEIVGRSFDMDLLLRQERKFVNRFGQLIFEDILHLSPSERPYDQHAQEEARLVGLRALREATACVDRKSSDLLRAACSNATEIGPSPVTPSIEEMLPVPLRPQIKIQDS